MATTIVIGAGQAGAEVASRLRDEGYEGRIILVGQENYIPCLLYTSPSPRDAHESRMPSSA